MKRTLLAPQALAAALATLPGWELQGGAITRRYDFTSYTAGIDFVVLIAQDAEVLDHHPDLQVGWRKVTATLTTHSASGLTDLDIEMARRMEARRAMLG